MNQTWIAGASAAVAVTMCLGAIAWDTGAQEAAPGTPFGHPHPSAAAASRYETPFTRANIDERYEPYGYVAHALGAIDGNYYTNTLEAFEDGYRLGFRVFECDLVLLADGSVLVAHDKHEQKYGMSITFGDAEAADIPKTYKGRTVMFERDLLRLVDAHPDVYMILDTKSKTLGGHFKILERVVAVGREVAPAALERLIPHVRGQGDLERTLKIYPFNDVMVALYRSRMTNSEVVDFVARNKLRAVMMWWNTRYDPAFDEQLRAAGAVTFVHSLGPRELRHLLGFRDRRVGVYSNGVFLNPDLSIKR
jgi:glycerophosphoryl diester phosphodiesterase